MRINAIPRFAFLLIISALFLGTSVAAGAQSPPSYLPGFANPLPIDSGSAGLWQSLQKLHTRASLIAIVAHPDDEDGGMLTYESRGQGVDTTLLTLTRGEGGQNVMSSDYWDQLGLVRTQELLAAGNHYGVHQYWASVADYGFSKTIEEAMKNWGHDRVLYDVVRVVRMTRPMVITSTFAGNVSDGHGHHQVSGEMAQEVFNAAADPNVFPDQIAAGLLPWKPLKVYARVPFARFGEKGIYDYATGHWEPVRFRNYVDGTWIDGVPSTTLNIPEGSYNALFGRSYIMVGREGLGEQKSQNGGIAAPTIRPFASPYHLYASRVSSSLPAHEESYFDGIDTSLAGIASYAPADQQAVWNARLSQLNTTIENAIATFNAIDPAKTAPALAQGLLLVNSLIADLDKSNLPAEAKYNMSHELLVKQAQFNTALGQALGLRVLATLTTQSGTAPQGPFGDLMNQPTSQTVIPGESFNVNVHVANQSSQSINIDQAELVSHAGEGWKFASQKLVTGTIAGGDARDQVVSVTASATAELTRPYFSRPALEQSYYDIRDPRYLNLSTTPYPLTAKIHYTYNGVAATLEGVVQSIHRYTGPGPVLEPLLVAPAISVTVSPQAGIVPLTGASVHLQVVVQSSVKGQAQGTVRLQLPKDWRSTPESAPFSLANDGDEQVLAFNLVPQALSAQPYAITAVAEYNGQQYTQGFQTTGYAGLRPYPFYRDAAYHTSGVDVKVAPQLKIGYIAGTGDDVAGSMQDLGINVNFLTADDIAKGDLSSYDAIVLGIRAYAARPELKASNNRLLDYTRNGGTVIVQYQTGEYDHNYAPYPLSLSSDPEKVVEEDGEVSILSPNDVLLSWPNKITLADFHNWVEERGHGFIRTWDAHYNAPTEMHDAGQDAQKGGLLYATYGKGTYIYMSYAFFRQMPDGVPGAFRIMANLVSAGKNPALHVDSPAKSSGSSN
jgi:LmbE family N-acetylglucosaminyl deacetylase